MPSGKIHAITTTLVAGAAGPVLYLATGLSLAGAAAFSAGCLAGLVINPDLDIRHPTYSHQVVRHSAGLVVASVWRIVWWPYTYLLIPRHRHPLSHLPVLGTAVRVIYLLGLLGLAWWILRLVFPLPTFSPLLFEPVWWWGLGGLALVDTLHTLMDWIM